MSARSIETAVQKLAGTYKKDDLQCMFCTVQKVNEDAATCDVIGDNGIVIPGVKLQAGVCDGLLLIPANDSTVIVAISKYNDPFVFMMSDIDKFCLSVTGQGSTPSITITSDGKFQLNDGSYNGLVKADDLVKKINALESLVNNILTTLQATIIPAGGMAYAFNPLYLTYNSLLPLTMADDIQSKKITHGQ